MTSIYFTQSDVSYFHTHLSTIYKQLAVFMIIIIIITIITINWFREWLLQILANSPASFSSEILQVN